MRVRLVSPDMLAAGFQAALRWTEMPRSGSSAGTLRPLDGRVAVVEDSTGRVSYVQHTRAGTTVEDGQAEWSFEWTAPEEGGDAILHIAANSGSGDNSPLEDLVYTHEVELGGPPNR